MSGGFVRLLLSIMKVLIGLSRGFGSAYLPAAGGGAARGRLHDVQSRLGGPPAQAPPNRAIIQGRWQGVTDVSEATGHNDQLRAVITKKDDGDYTASLHAKYHKVMNYGYRRVPEGCGRRGRIQIQRPGEPRLAGGRVLSLRRLRRHHELFSADYQQIRSRDFSDEPAPVNNAFPESALT